MRDYFNQLAETVCAQAAGIDRISLSYSAESSDFIRFNHAAVRQAGHVQQRYGTVSVVAGQRRASASLALCGDLAADAQALLAERAALCEQLPLIPEDAYLLLPDTVTSTERVAQGLLPSASQVIEAVAKHAAQTDFVGFYAGGPVVRGFADSRGQRNWHGVASFQFEWCLYRAADQAVKTSYAGTHWDEAVFARKMQQAREQATLLARPRKTLAPGAYRAYFSPVAVADLLGTLSWGGFGIKSVKTGVSTLILAHRGQAQLHPAVALTEATGKGIAPCFQSDGFVKPDAVALVRAGQVVDTLNSPRSATEYGVQANGCNGAETPESLDLGPGSLPDADVLKALGTGVYLSDLHYLNYSDRQASRMTGMTRFACFWVEDGRLVAPMAVMRFDDAFLRMFGSGLIALTQTAELAPESATYGARQLRSITAPGALVEGFRFTL
ncbi:MAG TPA: metallopeptidase TldD-related protein [Burkholderiaceae bacterium]|nr:metallopeptidase TldD-related protein [Burkholderiaceae bacterium]